MAQRFKRFLLFTGAIFCLTVLLLMIGDRCYCSFNFFEYRIVDFESVKPSYQYVADRVLEIYSEQETDGSDMWILPEYDRETGAYYLGYNGKKVIDDEFSEALRQVEKSFDNDAPLEDITVNASRVEFRNHNGLFAVYYAVDGKKPTGLRFYGENVRAKRVVNEKTVGIRFF